ncbi:hypothetical protein PISL3812_00808 [Talaromyces islandicus]|uniref:Tafazzin n=1 Tax=Talaromyces islandicus TaxID=28573 RepID=A0A0U1LKB4_TALIS|nr:hypothetical protein PISL3812_00808 [Talaromyces islandicus]
MPKKYNKYASIKPANTVHPSLQGPSTGRQHGSSSASGDRSVNDLIHHLRRTQVTSPGESSANLTGTAPPRTLHPTLRNIFAVPETPPPRPRNNARARFRRTPGPPPPSSWLENTTLDDTRTRKREGVSIGDSQVIHRLERLPGVTFPPKNSLQHTLLKSMATNWMWHVDYDGEFLLELPDRIKILLLSYIGIYSRDVHQNFRANGLYNLFAISDQDNISTVKDVTRLDLGSAVGSWISVKALSNQLLVPAPARNVADTQQERAIPVSWDEASDVEQDFDPVLLPTSPLSKSTPHILRFSNLRYLSLAHPVPVNASWGSLLNMLSHLSTLTHLSLAHWPIPTLTPNSINTRVRHPIIPSLTFAAGGTDTYTADEDNWVEAAGILRKLCRTTYCLKWLDLEGCGEWLGTLIWDGRTTDGEQPYVSPWPEWNGSWRDIEWIGLGPGWLPSSKHISDDDFPSDLPLESSNLAHFPPGFRFRSEPNPDDLTSVLTEDDIRQAKLAVEKQRRINEWRAYENELRKARKVEKHVHAIRRERGGKWIHFSFGGESDEERKFLEKALENIDKR